MSEDQENVQVGDGADGVVDNSTAQPAPQQAASGGRKRGGKKGGYKKKEDRVWIRMANSPEIPPTGQFIGVNGYGYLLKPNQKAHVPKAVLEVLDNAVQAAPIVGENGQIEGYQEVLRFPYSVLSA